MLQKIAVFRGKEQVIQTHKGLSILNINIKGLSILNMNIKGLSILNIYTNIDQVHLPCRTQDVI